MESTTTRHTPQKEQRSTGAETAHNPVKAELASAEEFRPTVSGLEHLDDLFRNEAGSSPNAKDRDKIFDKLDGDTEIREQMRGWKTAPSLTRAIALSYDTLHEVDSEIDATRIREVVLEVAREKKEHQYRSSKRVNRLITGVAIGAGIATLLPAGAGLYQGLSKAAYDHKVVALQSQYAQETKVQLTAQQEEMKKTFDATRAKLAAEKATLENQQKELTQKTASLEETVKAKYATEQTALAKKQSELTTKEASLKAYESEMYSRFFGPLPSLLTRYESNFSDLETKFIIKDKLGDGILNLLSTPQNAMYDYTTPDGIRIFVSNNTIFKLVDGKIVGVFDYSGDAPMKVLVFNGTQSKLTSSSDDITVTDNHGNVSYHGKEGAGAYMGYATRIRQEFKQLEARGPNGPQAPVAPVQK